MSFISRRPAFLRNTGRAGNTPLTDEQIMAVAPSAFAVDKHESRSERYAYIPTAEVIAGLRANGFVPMSAKQGSSRIPGKAEFTKHLIRFRHAGQAAGPRKVGDTYPEIVLVNSHDGTSAYKVMAGLFRWRCLNGLVVADRDLASVTIPHKGNVTELVIEGSYTVLDESRKALETADAWSGATLSRDEQMAMAEAAHDLRFADDDGQTRTPIRPEQLLAPRRHEDTGRDLWTTTNVIQEHVIRGGLTAMGRDAHDRPRRVTSRPIQGIDQDVKLNRALWLLSERMAQIKAAA